MTTLIFDWSDWEGPASGWVTLTRRTWRRDPDTYQVPWTRQVRVKGRAVVPVEGMDGEVLRVRWSPDGGASRTEHVLVPAEGEHLVHLLERVDPSTLEPLGEEHALTAADVLAKAAEAAERAEDAAEQAEASATTARDAASQAREAVQATLEDVLGGRVQLMPGGTVVSSAPTSGREWWRFTNLSHVPSTYLTLTDGAMVNEYFGAGGGQCFIFQGPGGARLVELGLLTGNMDLQPEEGSGWLIASISRDASEEAREYFLSLYESIPGAIYAHENPSDWSGPQIIVMPYRADAPGWEAPSYGYANYRATVPMNPFVETTTMSLIRPLSPDEIDALGISLPFRYMTPAEMAPHLDGGA